MVLSFVWWMLTAVSVHAGSLDEKRLYHEQLFTVGAGESLTGEATFHLSTFLVTCKMATQLLVAEGTSLARILSGLRNCG